MRSYRPPSLSASPNTLGPPLQHSLSPGHPASIMPFMAFETPFSPFDEITCVMRAYPQNPVFKRHSEARRELGAYFRFYNDQRPHQALGYRTPAEVFHQVTDVGEEGAVQAKEFPIDQTLVSLAGAARLSLNSTSVLSN